MTYHLEGIDPEKEAAAERAHAAHAEHCPVARSIRDSIAITTELNYT